MFWCRTQDSTQCSTKLEQRDSGEIVHIETGRWPLRVRVKSLQLKFWQQMRIYIAEHPESALAKVHNMGLQAKSPYLNYYSKLECEFGDPVNCEKYFVDHLLFWLHLN